METIQAGFEPAFQSGLLSSSYVIIAIRVPLSKAIWNAIAPVRFLQEPFPLIVSLGMIGILNYIHFTTSLSVSPLGDPFSVRFFFSLSSEAKKQNLSQAIQV